MSTRSASAATPRERLLQGIPVTEARYTLAGIETAVLEGGSGQPLVLLHGPGEYAAKWVRVLPDLVSTTRVIAPDLPAHGTSGGRSPALEPTDVLDWVEALIQETCDVPPVLLGHIIGGAIAARFAAARPGRIRQLVLVDALGLAPFDPAPAFGRALMAFAAQPSEETHERLWERCAFDLDRLKADMGARWDALEAYNLDRARVPETQAAQQRLMEAFGLPPIPGDTLSGISVPTALVWGCEDLATRLAVAREASSRYGWPLHVIEGAADDPSLEQPDEFLRVLRLILGENENAPTS